VPRVADRAVPAQPRLEHAQEHRHLAVYVVEDPDLTLTRMQPMQPARVLHERTLPRYGQREEESIKSRVVEAFTDVAPGREEQTFFVRRNRHEFRARFPVGLGALTSLQHDEVSRDAFLLRHALDRHASSAVAAETSVANHWVDSGLANSRHRSVSRSVGRQKFLGL